MACSRLEPQWLVKQYVKTKFADLEPFSQPALNRESKQTEWKVCEMCGNIRPCFGRTNRQVFSAYK